MSDQPTERDAAGGLQFERAEFEQPKAAACASCQAPLHGIYYDVNGAMLCERCHDDLALSQGTSAGGAGRAGRALALGLLATIAASVAWFAIRRVTGYEFGILAIGVGLLVGSAVRKGAQRRGGWKYQALAMFLTYTSIVVTYVPEIVAGIGNEPPEAAATASPAPAASASPTVPTAAPSAATSSGSTTGATAEPPGLGAVLFAVGFLLALAYAAPFFVVFQDPSALMGLVIIGIALYEAWKLNRRVPLQISGPHRIGDRPVADERA